MTKNTIVEKVVDETVDTLIDSLDELTVDYMYEYGHYTESNTRFALDKQVYEKLIVKELYDRLMSGKIK